MRRFQTVIQDEPVLSAGVVLAVISTGLAAAIELGWITLTADQMTAVMAFFGALAMLITAVVRWWFTTSLFNPKAMDGTPLVRQDGRPHNGGRI